MGVDRVSNEAQASNRRSKRSRVLLAASIRTAGVEKEVRLRDLSQKGALIECERPPSTGSELVFSRGSTVVTARVAWSAGKRAGLEFVDPIDESEVLKHTDRGAAQRSTIPLSTHVHVPADRFKRPGIGQTTMTLRDRKLAEMWGVQVGINISDD